MSLLRVLLVEDQPGEAALIRERLLATPGTRFEVEWTDRLALAIGRLQQHEGFDVVLLDLSLPDSSGLETLRRLQREGPDVPVIILSGNDDESLALEAVRAGAEDFLVKTDFAGETLARTLRHTVERASRRVRSPRPDRQPSGRVIGFLGAKGGVGVTTVAMNVAVALQRSQREVILAELRSGCGTLASHVPQGTPWGSLSALTSLEPDNLTDDAISAAVCRPQDRFGVLFGPRNPGECRILSPDTAGRIVGALSRMAPIVLLDLPSDTSEATREAARCCDFLGVVVEREPASVYAARVVLEQLRDWKAAKLVAVIATSRTPLDQPVALHALEHELGLPVMSWVPPAPDECALALRSGMSLVELYPDSLATDALVDLAARLTKDPIALRKAA